MENLSTGDRDIHIQAVIKSNLVSFNLSSADIDTITHDLTADILNVLEQFDYVNSDKVLNGLR